MASKSKLDHGFSDRMDLAQSLLNHVERLGGEVLLEGRKLRLRNVDADLIDEVAKNAKAIAEYLSIEPAEISEKVLREYRWLSEFAEEFARTAWRRIGSFSDREANEFYNLVAVEFNETSSKVEPGLGVLMAIADALTNDRIEMDRRAHELAKRDGVPASAWRSNLEYSAKRRAEQGAWRRSEKVIEVGDGIPF